jgi:hypothetical protein
MDDICRLLAIILADPTVPALALVHAGWRGTVGAIAVKAWKAMRDLGAKAQSTTAYLGPAICQNCYEVGEDVASLARRLGPAGEQSLEEREGRLYLDLPGLNASLLEAKECGPCTVGSALPAGRICFSAIAVRPEGRVASPCVPEWSSGSIGFALSGYRRASSGDFGAGERRLCGGRPLAVRGDRGGRLQDADRRRGGGRPAGRIADFGENRPEEAQDKVAAVAAEVSARGLPTPTWHMIGHIQSRKARMVVGPYSLVHSLDSLRLARRLSRLAEEQESTLNCLIEVNVGGEDSKYGYPPPTSDGALPRRLA